MTTEQPLTFTDAKGRVCTLYAVAPMLYSPPQTAVNRLAQLPDLIAALTPRGYAVVPVLGTEPTAGELLSIVVATPIEPAPEPYQTVFCAEHTGGRAVQCLCRECKQGRRALYLAGSASRQPEIDELVEKLRGQIAECERLLAASEQGRVDAECSFKHTEKLLVECERERDSVARISEGRAKQRDELSTAYHQAQTELERARRVVEAAKRHDGAHRDWLAVERYDAVLAAWGRGIEQALASAAPAADRTEATAIVPSSFACEADAREHVRNLLSQRELWFESDDAATAWRDAALEAIDRYHWPEPPRAEAGEHDWYRGFDGAYHSHDWHCAHCGEGRNGSEPDARGCKGRPKPPEEPKPEPQPSPRLPLRHVANEVIDADARYLALAGDIEIARWLVDRCNAPEPSASVARSEVSLLEAMTQLRDRLRAQASNAFLDDWRDLWTDVANELDRLANRGGGA